MKLDFYFLRPIIASGLFIAFLFFPQYFELILSCSFVFSIIVLIIERRKINKIIRNNILPTFFVGILSVVIYFLTKVYATHYFNNEYEIFTQNLNYSVQAWAGIVGTVSLILVLCIILIGYFFVQMIKEPTKELKGWIKVAEFSVYSFACAKIFIWLITLSSIVETYDKAFLRLDAYRYSDCQIPENQAAIRKNDETCYAFNLTGILEWELEPYSLPKKQQKQDSQ